MRDLYRLLRKLHLSYMQNSHTLLFLMCADSSKYTLHICGLCWQPQTNHSPFPFHSPAHIPVWIKSWSVCLTLRCALSHELEHVTRTACLSECVYVSVSLRSLSLAYRYTQVCLHTQLACKKKTKLTSSLLRTQTLSWHRPERKEKQEGQRVDKGVHQSIIKRLSWYWLILILYHHNCQRCDFPKRKALKTDLHMHCLHLLTLHKDCLLGRHVTLYLLHCYVICENPLPLITSPS